MRCLWIMFVTAVCFLFLLKLKWPKNKNIYDKLTPSGFHLLPPTLCSWLPLVVSVNCACADCGFKCQGKCPFSINPAFLDELRFTPTLETATQFLLRTILTLFFQKITIFSIFRNSLKIRPFRKETKSKSVPSVIKIKIKILKTNVMIK